MTVQGDAALDVHWRGPSNVHEKVLLLALVANADGMLHVSDLSIGELARQTGNTIEFVAKVLGFLEHRGWIIPYNSGFDLIIGARRTKQRTIKVPVVELQKLNDD